MNISMPCIFIHCCVRVVCRVGVVRVPCSSQQHLRPLVAGCVVGVSRRVESSRESEERNLHHKRVHAVNIADRRGGDKRNQLSSFCL